MPPFCFPAFLVLMRVSNNISCYLLLYQYSLRLLETTSPQDFSSPEQNPYIILVLVKECIFLLSSSAASHSNSFLTLDDYYLNWMIYAFLDCEAGFLTLFPMAFYFTSQQFLLSKESRFAIGFTITSSVVKTDAKQSVIILSLSI